MIITLGHLAQSGERFLHTEEVAGSSPVAPTMLKNKKVTRKFHFLLVKFGT